jgi:hypothetical protein
LLSRISRAAYMTDAPPSNSTALSMRAHCSCTVAVQNTTRGWRAYVNVA